MNLDTYITQRKAIPFSWGENDCCLFVADWIKAAHGVDYALTFRHQYKSKRGAFKALFKAGFKDIKSLFKHHLNNEIKVVWARRGDIALVNHDGELVGGIIALNCVYCVSSAGVVSLPLSHVDTVFTVKAIHE